IESLQNSTGSVTGDLLSRMGHQLSHYRGDELGSILTTVNRHLAFLDSAPLQLHTRTSSIDPAELKWGKLTIYLILPMEHVRAQIPLLRMWIASLLREVVSQGLDESRKTWWLLDECGALGHMNEALRALLETFLIMAERERQRLGPS